MCSDLKFFEPVVPLKCCRCHQWSYLEPGSSCTLCERTYKTGGGHTRHFEDQHSNIADEENEEQLKKLKKGGDLLKKLCNEVNQLKGTLLRDVNIYDASTFAPRITNSLNGARKDLQKLFEHVNNAAADHNQNTKMLKMQNAKLQLQWHNRFLRTARSVTVCISCSYTGRDYVAHLHSKQHVVGAYPLLVVEELLQEAGKSQGSLKLLVPQTIIDIILEYSVDAPFPEFEVTPIVGPKFKIALDELLPYFHQRSTKKRRKPNQGNQELARKYRKIWYGYYIEAKVKPWCKGGTCFPFKYGGICRCVPKGTVAPMFAKVLDHLTRDSPERLARTTVHSWPRFSYVPKA